MLLDRITGILGRRFKQILKTNGVFIILSFIFQLVSYFIFLHKPFSLSCYTMNLPNAKFL